MSRDNQFDVIIIGTGAGGGTLAYHLAPSGKRILILERGNYVTRKHRIDTNMADPNRYADLPAREKQLKELSAA